jgi:hypothetical protein
LSRIDDQPLRGSNFPHVVRTVLSGEVGSILILHWRRPGEAGEHSASLQREPLNLKQAPESAVPISIPR